MATTSTRTLGSSDLSSQKGGRLDSWARGTRQWDSGSQADRQPASVGYGGFGRATRTPILLGGHLLPLGLHPPLYFLLIFTFGFVVIFLLFEIFLLSFILALVHLEIFFFFPSKIIHPGLLGAVALNLDLSNNRLSAV